MRIIYLDEAGIQDKDPVKIVAGLIVHGDNQGNYVLSQAMRPILETIPVNCRKPYFHAKDIFNGRVNKEWSVDDRLEVMHKVMAIPRALNIPIAIGICKRGAIVNPFVTSPQLSQPEQEHWVAMYSCLGWADHYLENLSENALAVSEDIPRNRDFFRQIPELKTPPFLNMPGILPWRTTGIEAGMMFVGKADKIGIQLADACAFGFRRYLEGQSMGEDFVRTITGEEPDASWFNGDIWGHIFSWK